MSSFVKLPSGSGLDAARILHWEFSDTETGEELYITFDTGSTTYEVEDARALYAYLSAQATAIAEYGKPVDTGVKVNTSQVKLSFELTESQWSALEFLGQNTDRALSFADLERKARISLSELEKLEIERLIVRNNYAYPNTFELSASGFDFLVNEATK